MKNYVAYISLKMVYYFHSCSMRGQPLQIFEEITREFGEFLRFCENFLIRRLGRKILYLQVGICFKRSNYDNNNS